ncbi:hypothetical protein CYMTET_19581 [Cymbomonas tetramitiformis]|uniref:Glycerophosphocholine acyltransferase 1 n=1 Tax=Cymbomonas tetramitiformis TaxID=36881 RepID=A0AAE0L4U2_9CHLO|nr:hypothetical protein CYMTET_19581 [Cymbomonas tetramitiformis]
MPDENIESQPGLKLESEEVAKAQTEKNKKASMVAPSDKNDSKVRVKKSSSQGEQTTGRRRGSTRARIRANFKEASDKMSQQLKRVSSTASLEYTRYSERVQRLRRQMQKSVRPSAATAGRAVRALSKLVDGRLDEMSTESNIYRTRQKVTHFGSVIGVLFTAWVCGNCPQNLHLLFYVFICTGVPGRCIYYFQMHYQYFLIDFCYFVNTMVAVFLLFYPNDARVQAMTFAIAEGPVATAIIAWRCSWVFGSNDHIISVLLHFLPGLAVFSHIFHRKPNCEGELIVFACKDSEPQLERSHFHLLVSPFLFYCAWQLIYFVVVHIYLRDHLLRNKEIDTSYRALARRAQKSNNWLNRFVRKGPAFHRVAKYGLIQATYTIATIAVVYPFYGHYW